jgi:hypothetical protein
LHLSRFWWVVVDHRQYKREVKAMAGTLDRLAVTGAIKQ